MPLFRFAIVVLASAALALTGCGGDKKTSSAATTATTPATTASTPATTTAAPQPAGGAGNKDLSRKPTIAKGSGPPPKTLVVQDIVKGSGPGAKPGDQLTMQYVGALYDTGQEFDASWDRGQPFQLKLGAGMVIPGWDKGLVGIQKGGRRKLIIPPDMGYGASGQPPTIPPNATLTFIVDRTG